MAANGTSSRPANGFPSWSPAALLQPNRRAPAVAQNPTGSATAHENAGAQLALTPGSGAAAPSPLIFQFSDPTGTATGTEGGIASAPPTSDGHNTNGMGRWIEQTNNLQDRSDVPQIKRRKLEDGETTQEPDAKNSLPVRGGTGILADYVKEKRKEGKESSAATTVDLTNGNDDEVSVADNPRDEEVCYGMVKTMLNCSRVPSPKPGSQSLWGVGYNPGIKVVLKRQVGDKSNKIQAYDHTRETIGFVDPKSSAALTPLLDTKIFLRTDCRIPPQPKRPGEEPGQRTSRAYNLDIVMYGPNKYAKNVGLHLSKHSLRLLAPHMVQKGIKVKNPHILEYRPPEPKVYPTDGQGNFAAAPLRTVEEIRSEVMGVFDSLTRNEDLPSADPSSCITTPLLKHQSQGLYFMMAREKPRREHTKEKAMVSFWQIKTGAVGQRLHQNVITGQVQKDEPPETRGGILADMMGLGKTLSILALVSSTLDDARQWELLEPAQPSAPEPRPSRGELMSAQSALPLTNLSRNIKSTLLVCPLSTVTNWEEQIKQHVKPEGLTYHVYHGSNRIKDPAKLAEFDIIITTYGSVSNELSSRRKGKDGLYPLEQMGWFRIVLDEAHMIREQATLQFKAICRLQAQRRWAVTGTPVQNRLDDFAALLAFLRLKPFDDRGKFQRFVVEPFKACDPEIVPKLRVLVDTITLRRLKDKINLPPREDLIVKLDFSPEERSIYDMFAKNAMDRVKILTGTNNGKALGGNTYIHILKAILRLRLLCAHGKDLLNDDDLETLQGMSAETAIDLDDDDDVAKPALSHQKAHEMFTLMQDTNSDACIDCSKKLGSSEGSNLDSESQDDILGYMTPCFHVVCRSCIRGYEERSRALMQPGQSVTRCVVCNEFARVEFVEIRQSDVDSEHAGIAKAKSKGHGKNLDKYSGPHTKTKALLEDLLKSKAASQANPSEAPLKSVVFSGWTSHLDLIELALMSAEICFTRLDGSMTRAARTAAMDSFRDDPNVHIILVSIMAGGLGLNLNAGNNVYVMEPQYNPAAEAQAIDRVHRLGQTRPVRTIRYIMRDSFEEKMLEIQDKKVKLASLSMDGQSRALDKAEAARQKLMDLRSLFK